MIVFARCVASHAVGHQEGGQPKHAVVAMPTIGAIARLQLVVPLAVLAVLTMTVANVSAVWQRNVKRMLAYSSVEHMGILAFGLALGQPGAFGALQHVVNN